MSSNILFVFISTIVGGVREYCPSEYFNVSCHQNNVIFMTAAKYGRMSSGRCVTAHHGALGCSKNVLPFMDKKCSGKQKCQVYIAEPELHDTKPCPRDFASYLEASFDCVPGNVVFLYLSNLHTFLILAMVFHNSIFQAHHGPTIRPDSLLYSVGIMSCVLLE